MLMHIDSFDQYNADKDFSQMYNTFNNIRALTDAGRFDGGCMQLLTTNSNLVWTCPTNELTNVWTGFALKIANGQPIGKLVQFISLYGSEIKIQYDSISGIWQILNKSNTIIFTTLFGITSNTWHWIDIYFLFNNCGQIALFVDTIEIFDYLGNTMSSDIQSFSSIMIGDNQNESIYNTFIDDWYILSEIGNEHINGFGDAQINTNIPQTTEII